MNVWPNAMSKAGKVKLTNLPWMCAGFGSGCRFDNIFRTTTELHLFLCVLSAMVYKYSKTSAGKLESDNLSDSIVIYDTALFLSFVVLVPGAFVAMVICKLLHVQRVLHTDTNKDPTKLAFDLMTLGLATKDDRNKLQTYVDTNLQVWLG